MWKISWYHLISFIVKFLSWNDTWNPQITNWLYFRIFKLGLWLFEFTETALYIVFRPTRLFYKILYYVKWNANFIYLQKIYRNNTCSYWGFKQIRVASSRVLLLNVDTWWIWFSLGEIRKCPDLCSSIEAGFRTVLLTGLPSSESAGMLIKNIDTGASCKIHWIIISWWRAWDLTSFFFFNIYTKLGVLLFSAAFRPWSNLTFQDWRQFYLVEKR